MWLTHVRTEASALQRREFSRALVPAEILNDDLATSGGERNFAALCPKVRCAKIAAVGKINFRFSIWITAAFPHASIGFCLDLNHFARLNLNRRNPSLVHGLHLGLG